LVRLLSMSTLMTLARAAVFFRRKRHSCVYEGISKSKELKGRLPFRKSALARLTVKASEVTLRLLTMICFFSPPFLTFSPPNRAVSPHPTLFSPHTPPFSPLCYVRSRPKSAVTLAWAGRCEVESDVDRPTPFARWSAQRGEPSGPRLTVKMFKAFFSNAFKFEPCCPNLTYNAKRR
jgi:hypothetical protein